MPNVDCDLPVMGPTPPDEVITSRSMQEMMDDPTLVLTGTEPPIVINFDPALATAIGKRTILRLTVQPVAPALLERTMLLMSFPLLRAYETVHDGDGFADAYPAALGNTRVANGNGWDFTLIRTEGWPASPRVVPVAVDEFGNINPVSSVIYAWTLVD